VRVAPQGQIAARKQAELRREKAHQRMQDRSQAASSSSRSGTKTNNDVIPASDKQSMPQRIKRWKATGIISLRSLQLCSIPEGFQQHLEALGPTTIASLYAVDVGNNFLEHLPGESDTLCCTSALAPVAANTAPWHAFRCATQVFLSCRCISEYARSSTIPMQSQQAAIVWRAMGHIEPAPSPEPLAGSKQLSLLSRSCALPSLFPAFAGPVLQLP